MPDAIFTYCYPCTAIPATVRRLHPGPDNVARGQARGRDRGRNAPDCFGVIMSFFRPSAGGLVAMSGHLVVDSDGGECPVAIQLGGGLVS